MLSFLLSNSLVLFLSAIVGYGLVFTKKQLNKIVDKLDAINSQHQETLIKQENRESLDNDTKLNQEKHELLAQLIRSTPSNRDFINQILKILVPDFETSLTLKEVKSLLVYLISKNCLTHAEIERIGNLYEKFLNNELQFQAEPAKLSEIPKILDDARPLPKKVIKPRFVLRNDVDRIIYSEDLALAKKIFSIASRNYTDIDEFVSRKSRFSWWLDKLQFRTEQDMKDFFEITTSSPKQVFCSSTILLIGKDGVCEYAFYYKNSKIFNNDVNIAAYLEDVYKHYHEIYLEDCAAEERAAKENLAEDHKKKIITKDDVETILGISFSKDWSPLRFSNYQYLIARVLRESGAYEKDNGSVQYYFDGVVTLWGCHENDVYGLFNSQQFPNLDVEKYLKSINLELLAKGIDKHS